MIKVFDSFSLDGLTTRLRGVAWGVVASALTVTLLGSSALADPIRIEIQDGPGNGKDLVVVLETFSGRSTLSVAAPANASEAAAGFAGFDRTVLDSGSKAGRLNITRSTTTKKINGIDTTFHVLVIDPSTRNFNGGFIKVNPFLGGGTSLVTSNPANSKFELVPGGDGLPNDLIDWHLLLVGQDQSILAEANLFNVANTISAADLLDVLYVDLSADMGGLDRFGNEIFYDASVNSQNAYFRYSLSGAPGLVPTLSNFIVSLPGTGILVGLGLLAMIVPRLRWRATPAAILRGQRS